MVYLPSNTTAVLQPLDQGIINLFKVKFRFDLQQNMLTIIDDAIEDQEKFVERFLKNITMADFSND